MQNSFINPRRFGKSRLAPRSKAGHPAAQPEAAAAMPPVSDISDKPVRNQAPVNPVRRHGADPHTSNPPQQRNQVHQTKPAGNSGNPIKETVMNRPAHPPKTGNPTKPGQSGTRENLPKSGRPNSPANPVRSNNPVRSSSPVNKSSNSVKPGNPIQAGVSQNKPRSAAPQSSVVSHNNTSSRIRPAAKRIGNVQSNSKSLKVIALGGLREVGKNMFVLEYGEDMIIVDCGIGFPEENMPGIDVVIPDMSYVFQNKSKVRGVFFTHGHEDHIGAVSWLLREVQAPLYASKLTLALIKLKLEDRGGTPKVIDLHPVEDGDIIQAGSFSVEFIHTNHSIADANLLAIRTPVGIVVHTGDFKIDYTPINGDPISIPRIASIGQENPLLLLCESTNIEKPGFSMSESKVGESFINIFERAAGRIFVATFSSNIYRMQQIFTAAERFNRKVCLVGRSIVNVFQAANALGYMTMKPGTLVDINQIKSIPADQLVIISTGSQGEPMSALTRMAFNEHQKIEIHTGDTVIISASPIPGNEKPIYRVINELFLRGADVIYAALAEVHASGHAYQEELKLMHQLVRPKFFVPIHGEYRMLYQHTLLAQKMGTLKENTFLLSNGDVLELTPTSAKVTGYIPADGVLIDGSSMGDIGNLVLRERKLLSDDGVISVSMAVDRETGLLLGEPSIQARGFIYESEAERIIDESQNKIRLFINKCAAANKPLIPMIRSNALRDQLRDFLFDRTRRRPIVIVSLIEV